ncbi:DUF2783 domain-containing protein [Pseudoteredinibacter isoporae]|uniref:DUF2783 domain-containing protein n=1 Tax=Pseudoteredinibacter isoporae TaxID=570281 RepID=A0A7X0MYS1_9GAMM|nr:DUF2783 domain-containing protein [Pseudoteredinibacter isoporae]MBB6523384.1 hypothetical protein [Pseudoteredinibacter isoporae]NHO88896.1 DUF2783 domain-containing protein [Pseudoteredinibacter isoporae]NIB24396.1 DUF2783 domain-containing protein [Pseudoteredinibacter isoporae]
MLNKNLNNEEIETIYDQLYLAIDNAGPEQEAKMLAKLVLILANQLGDSEQVLNAIKIAEKDL